jgi:hypothetical protein
VENAIPEKSVKKEYPSHTIMTIPRPTKINPMTITAIPIGENSGIPRSSIPRITRSNPVIRKCATIPFLSPFNE